MLENLYETSIEELNGNFTQEMDEIIGRIRNSFTNLPSESELIQKANEKIMRKQLTPVDEIGKKKRKIVKLEDENEFIKYQLERKKVNPNNNLERNVHISMNKFFNDLNSIKTILKDEDKENNKENNIDNIR